MPRSASLLRPLFVAGCVVLALYEVWAVFIRETPAVAIEGARPAFANEFGQGARVSQAFQMMGDGLTAFDVRFSTDRPVTMIVQCELSRFDMPDAAPERSWATTIKRVSGVEWRRIEFPPIQASNNHPYTLRLQLISSVADDGTSPLSIHDSPSGERPAGERPRVALVASKDNVVAGGALRIADRRQVGSLSLRAFTSVRTAYGLFRTDVAPHLPGALSNAPVDLIIALAYQWALLTVVYALLAGHFASFTPAPSRHPQGL
jgi:hypothetical protein